MPDDAVTVTIEVDQDRGLSRTRRLADAHLGDEAVGDELGDEIRDRDAGQAGLAARGRRGSSRPGGRGSAAAASGCGRGRARAAPSRPDAVHGRARTCDRSWFRGGAAAREWKSRAALPMQTCLLVHLTNNHPASLSRNLNGVFTKPLHRLDDVSRKLAAATIALTALFGLTACTGSPAGPAAQSHVTQFRPARRRRAVDGRCLRARRAEHPGRHRGVRDHRDGRPRRRGRGHALGGR